MPLITSNLWTELSENLFVNIDEEFLKGFRAPGGPNNRLAAWDPLDPTMRYFKFLLFNACLNKNSEFFELYSKIGRTDLGNPIVVRVQGLDINIDHYFSIEEFMFVSKNIDLNDIKNIVEIGAGFGRTCQAFLSLIDSLERYIIIDLPKILQLSKNYLQKTLNETQMNKVNFLDATNQQSWGGIKSDLVINIDSFQEMPPATIDIYKKNVLQNSKYVYIKNPICKYDPRSIGINNFNYNKFSDVFSLGYCREIIDIFDEQLLAKARSGYLEAYCPSNEYQIFKDEPLSLFPYLHHVIYSLK